MLRTAFARGAATLGAFLFSGTVLAQTAPGLPSREELNPAQRTEAVAPQGELFSAPAAGPCPFTDSNLSVTLTEVRFSGLTGLPAQALRPAYSDVTGKSAGLAAICTIRDRVAAILFQNGILARVEIPEQKIEGGVLTLEVIEASVARVTVTGDAGPAKRRVESYARKLEGMKPFDLRKAQRYLLLAQDTPGIRLRTIVRPDASGARGAIEIEIRVERDAVSAVFNAQNSQPKTAGRFGALARVDFNSLTALGERTSLVFYRTVPDNEQFVVQALEEVRLGGSGLMARGSLAYGETRPGAALKPLDLRSISTVGSVELAYPLVRLRRQDVTLSGGLEIASQSTQFAGLGTRLTQDDLRVAYLRLATQSRPWFGRRQAVFGGDLELRKGLDALGASDRGAATASRIEGKPDAFVMRGSVNASLPLAPLFTLSARAQAQYSPDALLSYEELTLGNLSIGRGYDPASATGDSGVALAVEGYVGPFRVGNTLLSPYGFFDIGHVSNHDAAQADRTLKAAGLGSQIRIGPRVVLDVVWAHPFDAPQPATSRPSDRLLFNLTFGL